ncbi:hypothetical protein [Neorhizobium vignae]|jgi:hypothetical protein|uniref:hypothetical protein n=1 Tax=Neorhizobium vignae TaxID=690585 RepID=UPI000562F6A0|nr:hypothetical protein [Neorhizobium vignae]
MTVSLKTDTIILSGTCGAEEVETLVGYLESLPGLSVDLGAATAIHTALWQALMVFRPRMVGASMSSLVDNRLLLALNAFLDDTQEPPVKLAESSSSQ